MHQSAAAIFLTVLGGLAQPARADAGDGQPRRDISAVLGIGTPVGGLGLEGSYRVRPDLEVSVGLGVGLTATLNNFMPIQWAVMPRYRIGNDHDALTLGLGLSGGNYGSVVLSLCGSEEDFVHCNTSDTRYTLWANAEIGGEHIGPTGFMLRYFVGYGRMLAQGDHNCRYLGQPADPCAISGDSWFSANTPYLGVSLGHTF